jgi:hypothetical protein
MKYFKKELWGGFNNDSIPFAKADAEWNRNRLNYWRQFRKLSTRLSVSARTFFRSVSLHDGKLLRFETGEHIDFTKNNIELFNQPDVRISAINEGKTHIYTLRYHKVKKVVFDFPSAEPLFGSSTIGDWGYDELTSAASKLFRHEILFSSGATILIESPDITVKVEKTPKPIKNK